MLDTQTKPRSDVQPLPAEYQAGLPVGTKLAFKAAWTQTGFEGIADTRELPSVVSAGKAPDISPGACPINGRCVPSGLLSFYWLRQTGAVFTKETDKLRPGELVTKVQRLRTRGVELHRL